MKLLIATGIYPPESGGPATYVKLLEERLPSQGIDVSVLPFRDVRHLPSGIRHVVYFFKCLHRARKADAVFAQDTLSTGFPAALAARLAGKAFFVRVPGDYAWEQGRQRFSVKDSIELFQTKRYGLRVELMRTLQRYAVRHARRVIVPSEFMKHIVSRWTNTEKISVIYSSIELPVKNKPPTARPPGFLVVTVARLVPWKGVEGIIKAVAGEPMWRLVIVDDGPLRQSLESSVKMLGAENRITFVGRLPREEALGWIKTADVFVLNSTYEGLSHLLIEAMALGTPVVATEVGGNPELIEQGRDGLLIAPGNDAALRGALSSIARGNTQARERADRALVRVQQFSIDTTLDALCAVLKNG